MNKWEQLQLTPDSSKSEEEKGDYQDKTQKLFTKMRICVMRHFGFALEGTADRV